MTNRRKTAETKGRFAEQLAAIFLTLKGYEILEMRYKCPVGEIDIIARRGKILAFIEVKSRQTFELGILAINSKNRGRILSAANYYCMRNDWSNQFLRRFDGFIFAKGKFPKHIKDAFRAG